MVYESGVGQVVQRPNACYSILDSHSFMGKSWKRFKAFANGLETPGFERGVFSAGGG